MEAEGGKESNGGRRKGGRVIEEGGREGGGAMEGWGARPHLPGLIVARVRSCVLAVAGVRLVRGRLRSFPFVGVRPRPWAFVFVCGRPALFVGVHFSLVVRRWWVGGSLWPFMLQLCGGWWRVVCHRGSCDVGPASHVEKRRWGVGRLRDSPA